MHNDRYEIDILQNNQWKVLRYCNNMQEVCYAVKSVRSNRKCKLRVLENNNILEFINDDDFSLFYFIQKYEYYDDIQSFIADQKVLSRYIKFVGDKDDNN